jgi:dihydropteroate synthase
MQVMTPLWPKDFKPLLMGVMNLTPDSFSDGGLHQDLKGTSDKLDTWSKQKRVFPDFGAQSTAPMNHPISFEEEWKRIQLFFDHFKQSTFNKFPILSFDTYRPETMKSILTHQKIKHFTGQVVWNDVSGLFDDEVDELLTGYDNLFYAYTHNAVRSRDLTPRHREFSGQFSPDSILDCVTQKFVEVTESVGKETQERIILDPGFGFAKSPQTSMELLKNLPDLIHRFPKTQGWLIGLSRKSVLQEVKGPKNWEQLDKLQEDELKNLMLKCPQRHFIFRVHDTLPLTKSLL